MPETLAPKPRATIWKSVLAADYPMVALYKAFKIDDKSRRALALDVVREPQFLAEAFAKTCAAIEPYVSTHPFYDASDASRSPVKNDGELRATKDVALRLGEPQTRRPVDTSAVRGFTPGELDLIYLDRELTLTRTTKQHEVDGVIKPKAKLQADLLVASPDGTIGIGEIKVTNDRDLFYALIQALAGVALVSSVAQIRRIRSNHPLPAGIVLHGDHPKLDVVLVTVARDQRETYLTQLDVLARGFAPALMAQPAIAGVVRQIVCIDAALDDATDDLRLTAKWVEGGVA